MINMKDYIPHLTEDPNIYFDYIYSDKQAENKTVKVAYPVIFFIYSGCMKVNYQTEEIFVKKGECIFLQANTIASFQTEENDEERFCGIYIGFNKSFLFEFYENYYKKGTIKEEDDFIADIIKIPCTPYMQSLYISMIPYWEQKSKPEKHMMELKRKECIYCMLTSDSRFYKSLFDFIKPIKQNFFYVIYNDSNVNSKLSNCLN